MLRFCTVTVTFASLDVQLHKYAATTTATAPTTTTATTTTAIVIIWQQNEHLARVPENS